MGQVGMLENLEVLETIANGVFASRLDRKAKVAVSRRSRRAINTEN
jgi:hypothetical protein